MEPRDQGPANGRSNGDVRLVSAASLIRIRTPLAVAYGHVQLLQRRLRQGREMDELQLLQSLEQTEAALRAVEQQLRGLTDERDTV